MRNKGPLINIRINLDIALRKASEADLEPMEWCGLFTEHREIIRRTFARQRKGDAVMLLAVHRALPVGQCWIDLARAADRQTGVLWALRVIPWLQGHGIGQKLVAAAEAELVKRGYDVAELGVEKQNAAVIPFYTKLGYRRVGELVEQTQYTTPDGEPRLVWSEQWTFAKELSKPSNSATPTPTCFRAAFTACF